MPPALTAKSPSGTRLPANAWNKPLLQPQEPHFQEAKRGSSPPNAVHKAACPVTIRVLSFSRSEISQSATPWLFGLGEVSVPVPWAPGLSPDSGFLLGQILGEGTSAQAPANPLERPGWRPPGSSRAQPWLLLACGVQTVARSVSPPNS